MLARSVCYEHASVDSTLNHKAHLKYHCVRAGYSPPQVDRIWRRWGSYYNIPKAIFYLIKRDYKSWACAIGIPSPGFRA